MTDYSELVKALRYCGNFTEREGCAESCEYFNDMDCPNRIMSDAADAIEALQAEQKKTVTQIFGEEQQEWEEYCTGLMNRIRELKSQLPKRGEWIDVDKIKTYCSNCNWESYSMLVQKDEFLLRNNKTKFCPNCGAEMEVQE